MGQVFSVVLSPAIGVLISPFPIVGLILILLSDKARVNSIFYMIGWILGNAAVYTIALLCMSAGTESQDDPSVLTMTITLIIGILLVVCSVKEFRERPREGQEVKTPKWFDKMNKIGALGAGGFGMFLSALNPKNMLLSISAGTAVGALGVSPTYEIAGGIMYTLLASILIIAPTIAFLFAGKRLDELLESIRVWLVNNNAVIMCVLMFIIGINMIAKSMQ